MRRDCLRASLRDASRMAYLLSSSMSTKTVSFLSVHQQHQEPLIPRYGSDQDVKLRALSMGPPSFKDTQVNDVVVNETSDAEEMVSET
jgi:hypothetical protein